MYRIYLAGSLCLVLAAGCTSSGTDTDQAPSDPVDASTADALSPDAEADAAASDTGGSDEDDAASGADAAQDAAQDAAEDAATADSTLFRITSPRSDRPVRYRLLVAEQPSRVLDGSVYAAEESDGLAEETDGWMITGETGTAPSSDVTHGDSFEWALAQAPHYGILGWSADAPADDYTITINGTEIDPANLPELPSDPPPQTDCLGGGDCYDRHVTAADATVVLGASTTLSELRSALANASAGDIVFIDAGAEIDLGFYADDYSIVVPAGVTLAGDRGVNGSPGARLFGGKKPGSDWIGADTIKVHDNARITGLRIEGPDPDRPMGWLDADHDYTDGIQAKGSSNVEIDNNEIYGWPKGGISGGDPVHVHHNYIHDNDQSGLGYGVSSPMWGSVIEYNLFERNRHAIAGAGNPGEGYTVRYNVFGGEGLTGAGHKIDMHEDGNTGKAGSRIEVYRNTVIFPDAQGVFLRGTPRESAEIYENWFYNPTQPCLTKNRGSYCAIEVRADDWTNVTYRDNHYGSSEPGCGIGAPRPGC